jgi:penicillin-binding protein-related factor A (putative recombinase)
MIEAKSTANKERLTLAKRMHQFDQMRRTRARVGFGLYGYLIEWREAGEVRFYPVREIQVVSEKPLKINVVRQRGIIIPARSVRFAGPDWLSALP